MRKEIEIKQNNKRHTQAILTLLQSEKLPVADLSETLDNFIIAIHNNNIVGAIGLEQYDTCGLLRSLVVNRNHRNENVAGKLLIQLEEKASELGIHCMYLLTETAPDYFAKKGYEKIRREEVPALLQKSSEFSHICPQSAIVMKKHLIK